MKKFVALFSALLLAVFLTACGQNDNQTNSETEKGSTQENPEKSEDNIDNGNGQEPADDSGSDDSKASDQSSGSSATEEAKNQDDMKKMMKDLDFKEIEVEISYGKDKEYEAEIEHHDNGDIEAEVEDEINGEDMDDDLKAFNSIYPKAKKLNISKDTKKQDAIDQVLKAFDLKSDYEKFEVEFTFDDGTKLSFED